MQHTAQGLVHPHKHGLIVQDGAIRGSAVDKDDVGIPRDGGDLPSGILAGQVDDQRIGPGGQRLVGLRELRLRIPLGSIIVQCAALLFRLRPHLIPERGQEIILLREQEREGAFLRRFSGGGAHGSTASQQRSGQQQRRKRRAKLPIFHSNLHLSLVFVVLTAV